MISGEACQEDDPDAVEKRVGGDQTRDKRENERESQSQDGG
jgi:hypothetical protein